MCSRMHVFEFGSGEKWLVVGKKLRPAGISLKVSGFWLSELHASETAAATLKTSEDERASEELSKYISSNVNTVGFREAEKYIHL